MCCYLSLSSSAVNFIRLVSLSHVPLWCVRYWALRFAADAACTVLRVDQIIMAKVAGGPRRGDKPVDESED